MFIDTENNLNKNVIHESDHLKKKWNMLVRSQRKLDNFTGCSTRSLHYYEI